MQFLTLSMVAVLFPYVRVTGGVLSTVRHLQYHYIRIRYSNHCHQGPKRAH